MPRLTVTEFYLCQLKLFSPFFSNRTQRTKIKNIFRQRFNILYEVSHGSILGQLLFNIGLIDLFYKYEESDIASYADDTTPYSCRTYTQSVIVQLQITANKL